MDISIFGDSITYGASDLELGGWANRLRLHFGADDSGDAIYNLGVRGDNTEKILERLEREAFVREPDLIIVAIGINDSQYLTQEKRNRVPLEKFKSNISAIVEKARAIAPHLVFIGLTPVDEQRTAPIPWDSNKMYKNEYIQKYDEAIRDICRDTGVGFVDLLGEMIKLDYQAMLPDGLHPDAVGHDWIAQKVIEGMKDIAI